MNTTDLTPLPPRPSLEQYRKQAKELARTARSGDAAAIQRVRKYHPHESRLLDSGIPSAKFALADAQLVIAREHGFETWPKFAKHIEDLARTDSIVLPFESAADAIVTGDVALLEVLLRGNPNLIRARSPRVHRATLLHYVAANGFENYRQKSPGNAVEVARALLRAGAEVDALADTYGGQWATTMDLLVSSVHPSKAGVQSALVETLLDFGGAVNGVDDDGSPLLTALAFHYPEAAETLARRGARVDNIVTAAGLGREELVRRFVGDDGRLKADVPLAAIRWLRVPKESKAHLELALVWAAMHRRNGAVEILLEKGVDPGGRDQRRWTALHWAAYYGYLDTMELLLRWNPPLEAENEFGGTVLSQTIWCTVHEGLQPYHVPVIERLLDAGAQVEPYWLQADLDPPVPGRIAELLLRAIARGQ